ncbi:MAG: cob(I)yrinic acid a,c-diamide adenosyltransferase [Sphingobacteriales bacterium]|jgi:cob(I)alamin adenosyltransferase|nr:cob(I)yrinic acid a,c-diamide adenosyltransferase [Sphingobacteriales bacterium]
MAIKIYTKTGDKGTTSLIGGKKVSKGDVRIEAYGTVDELNSYIGLCRDLLSDAETKAVLYEIQDRLFTIGSELACDPGKATKMSLPDLHEEDCKLLETEIDKMNDILPVMKSFILPGGAVSISHLHIARCVCRRAERCVIRLGEDEKVDPIIVKYLNRLSDYLFMLARFVAHQNNIAEIPWRARV